MPRARPVQGVAVIYGDHVPGGKTQVPVSGDQFPAQARGCAAHTGGSVRKPPTTGPAGVCITYGGTGCCVLLACATGPLWTAATRKLVALEPGQLADRLNFGVPVGPSIGLQQVCKPELRCCRVRVIPGVPR